MGRRYRIMERLGRGGMSEIWRAFDRVRDEVVALKILDADSPPATLGAEFRFIASLDHPGVVSVHDFGLMGDGRPFFTMELIEGGDLIDYASSEPRRAVVQVVRTVCETLDFVHERGIVHGDLKPSNILMATNRFGARHPKLVDFGIAWRARPGEPPAPDAFEADGASGTVHYMAPELILRRQRDHRIDLYAVGVLLFELLTSRLPFDAPDLLGVARLHLKQAAPDPRDYDPSVPGELGELVLRLLEKSPAHRFGSAREVVAALDAALRPEQERAGSSGPASSARSWVVSSPRARVAGGARCVGREAELATLVGLATEAGRRGGALCVVSGVAGSGKTRLLQEMQVRVQVAGIACLRVDLDGCRSAAEAIERLGAVVAGAAGRDDLAPAGALFGAGPGSHAEPVEGGPWLAAEIPVAERLLVGAERIAEACAQLAAERTLVICLDDVHVVAEQAVPALRAFASGVLAEPVVVVATSAPGDGGAAPQLGALRRARRFELGPLAREQTADVVRSLCGQIGDAAVIGDHVHAESGGNPGAIERVVRALCAGGALVMRRGAWSVADHLAGKLPVVSAETGLREVAAAGLARLGVEARRLAQAAAYLGWRFEIGLLRCVAGPDAEEEPWVRVDLDEAVRALIDAHLVEPDGNLCGPDVAVRHRFCQRVVCELLLESLGAPEREELSRRIVAALESRRRQGEPCDREILAQHLRAVSRADEAGDVAGELLRDALRSGADTEVAGLLQDVLVASTDIEAYGRPRWCEHAALLGDAERRGGGAAEAMAWYERVIHAACGEDPWTPGPGGHARALPGRPAGRHAALCVAAARRKLGDMLMERGEAAGEAVLVQALGEARELGEARLVGRAAYVLASHQVLAGRYEEAARGISEALCMAEQTDDGPLRARVLKQRATLNWYRSRLADAEADARAAAEAFASLGSPRGAAESLGALGNALYARGDVDAAEKAFGEALEHARAARWLTGIGKLHNSLAMVAHRRDQWDAAGERWRAALAIAERTGNHVERVILLNNVGFVAAHRGEDEAARSLYGEALGLARQAAVPKVEARVLGNLGELCLERGELGEARRHLKLCIELAREIGADAEQIECEQRLLRLELADGADPTAVAARGRALCERAEAAGLAVEAAQIRRVCGEALARAGLAAEAEATLARAARDLEKLGWRYEAARVVRVAASLAAEGLLDPAGVASKLREARRLFRELRVQPELDRARAARGVLLESLRPRASAVPVESIAPRPSLPPRGAEGPAPIEPAAPQDVRAAPTTPSGPARADGGPELVGWLIEVMRQLGGGLELGELLERTVDAVLSVALVEHGLVVACDRGARTLARVGRGMAGIERDGDEQRVVRAVLGRVAGSRAPLVLDDLAAPEAEFLGAAGARLRLSALACLPLLHDGRLVGVLYVDARGPAEPWSPERVPLLELVAAQAAAGIDHALQLGQQAGQAELLAAGVQELLGPLRAIERHAARIRDELGAARPSASARLAVIHEQARRLAGMASALLDAAASSPDESGWSMVSVQVKDICETAALPLRPLGEISGVRVEVKVPPGLPTLFGDRDRLVRVVARLLAAAIDGAQGGGSVSVRARAVPQGELGDGAPPVRTHRREPLLPGGEDGYELCDSELVRIDVICRPACTPEITLRAADSAPPPPQRSSPRPPADEGEASLGMAMARDVVRRHGGRTWVEEAPAGGTCYALLFPSLRQRER
ncbi:MAG: protein kinase [Deltaproteobacteria bacterium]|nr:protein kinase [Deltaproteobacteria bacterium]